MAATADELRQEIAQRREDIGRDLDALGEKVSPGRVVHRRAERLGARAHRVKDAVMGTAEDAGDRVAATAGSATDRISSTASDAAEALRHAPQATRRQVEGNPLAAGLIAYGTGLLVGTLLPPTRTEREMAGMAEPALRSAIDEARMAGQEIVADLREPAQEAVEQMRQTATGAAQAVTASMDQQGAEHQPLPASGPS